MSNIFAPTIRRIKKIILVKVVELIEKIEEITNIKIIEIIESMPDLTLKGSEGVAFKQTTPSAGSWKSPDGYIDENEKWSDEAKAYDNDTETYAEHELLGTYQWGATLKLTFSTPIKANKLRFWIDNEDERVQISAIVDGQYIPVWWGKLGTDKYVEKSFSQGMVSEIWIRFYNYDAEGLYPRVHEAHVWEVPSTGGVMIVEGYSRDDTISLGATASPNGAGVQIVAGTAGQKIKVFDAGFEILAEGVHFFYFGTTTSPTTKRFLTSRLEGTFHQTFVNPRVGDAGDNLYLYSAVSETDMPYDIGYVKE